MPAIRAANEETAWEQSKILKDAGLSYWEHPVGLARPQHARWQGLV